MEPRSKLSLFFGNSEQTRFLGGKKPQRTKQNNERGSHLWGPISFCLNMNQYCFSEGRKMHEYKENKCLRKDIFGSFAKENMMYKSKKK